MWIFYCLFGIDFIDMRNVQRVTASTVRHFSSSFYNMGVSTGLLISALLLFPLACLRWHQRTRVPERRGLKINKFKKLIIKHSHFSIY